MRVSVCLGAILIPEYLDFHSGYSAPRSRIAGIYSGIYSKKKTKKAKMMFANARSSEGLFSWEIFRSSQLSLDRQKSPTVKVFPHNRKGSSNITLLHLRLTCITFTVVHLLLKQCSLSETFFVTLICFVTT